MNSNTVLAATLGITLAAIAAISAARAHDQYKSWRMPDQPTLSCCNEHDCRAVKASSDIDGNWTAIVDGSPVPIPKHKLMKMPSPDGRSHWCGTPDQTYCFVPGEVRG